MSVHFSLELGFSFSILFSNFISCLLHPVLCNRTSHFQRKKKQPTTILLTLTEESLLALCRLEDKRMVVPNVRDNHLLVNVFAVKERFQILDVVVGPR